MAGTALLSAVVMGAVALGFIRQAGDRFALGELRDQADAVSREALFPRKDAKRTLRFLQRALGVDGAALYRIQPDGSADLAGGDPKIRLDAEASRLAFSGSVAEGHAGSDEGRFVWVAQPLGDSLVLVLSRQSGLGALPIPVGTRMAGAALLAVSLAVLLSGFVASRVTSPLKELSEAAGDVAAGDFKRRVPIRSEDEVGVVAESFNRMAEQLGEADERQREFFLSISHELRTPLTAIQGYAEAIEDGTASGSSLTRSAGVIVDESKRLSRLVSDLLDLARIDASRFAVNLEAVDVAATLAAVELSFAPKAEEAGVDLSADCKGEVLVMADPDRLVQVLSNLVENALRYTPSGKSIHLSARPEERRCCIEVVDGGVGFDAQDLERAFERQFLWGKYRGVRDVGTGLGLAITKELVVAMGGTVRAGNSADGGARFVIDLPAA